jgi:hypothetical protein
MSGSMKYAALLQKDWVQLIALIGLLLFVFSFVLVLIRIFSPNQARHYNKLAHLPLEEKGEGKSHE